MEPDVPPGLHVETIDIPHNTLSPRTEQAAENVAIPSSSSRSVPATPNQLGPVPPAGVPAVCFDRRAHVASGQRAIEINLSELDGLAGNAVIVCTGHAEHWGTERYFADHPYLTKASAEALVRSDVACVGIATLNIDNTEGGERPVHTTLLRSEVPIIEHLRGLEDLPANGFTFTAVPPKIAGAGTFTVRAFATL